MTRQILELRERLAELEDLRMAAGLLSWDQQTMMPSRGGPQRADALATLERISHEQFIAAETGRLLQAAGQALTGEDPDSDDACLVRLVQHRWDKARMVPSDLAAEIAKAGSVGQEAWVAARRANDFDAFAPHLERNIALARRYAECFEGFDCAYDALLDDYEPDMTAARVTSLFAELKSELIPLIARVAPLGTGRELLQRNVSVERQRDLVSKVLAMMGFDASGWRLDEAVHPFATSFGATDVRITTRWDESYFPAALFGAMHECGHGLYEAGIAPALQRTALGHGESLGMHESQSRLWENQVARSRGFWRCFEPRLRARFPAQTAGIGAEELYLAINAVAPTPIRVDADEVTYNLHIILRFELEKALFAGTLAVRDLPAAWKEAAASLLGLVPRTDREGVLQDVHWSGGAFGYFPSYCLGNMMAAQLWYRAAALRPGLEEDFARGDFSWLLGWLRENIHARGRRHDALTVIREVTGADLSPAPLVRYLRERYGALYLR